jgi:hypothetical protein
MRLSKDAGLLHFPFEIAFCISAEQMIKIIQMKVLRMAATVCLNLANQPGDGKVIKIQELSFRSSAPNISWFWHFLKSSRAPAFSFLDAKIKSGPLKVLASGGFRNLFNASITAIANGCGSEMAFTMLVRSY